MSTNGKIALGLSYCGASYSVPYYTLPWNLFFGKTQPLPFYETSVLNAISARLAQSSLNYDPHIVLRVVDPAVPIPTPVTPTFLNTLAGFRRVEYYNPAQKVLIGPSVNCKNLYQFDPLIDYAIDAAIINDSLQTADIVYQYNVNGRLYIKDTGLPGPVVNVWSIDLKGTTGFVNIDIGDVPVYKSITETPVCVKKAIGGTINGVPFDDVTPLDPLNPFPVGATNQYLITGNRLWLFLQTPTPYTPTTFVTFQINFQIVERPLPATLCEYARQQLVPLTSPYPCCI